jgi:hypothetical protein
MLTVLILFTVLGLNSKYKMNNYISKWEIKRPNRTNGQASGGSPGAIEYFESEAASWTPPGGSSRSPEEEVACVPLWVQVVVGVTLLVVAAFMARNCKDKGLNYAMVMSDPIAYIIGRLLFGRC